MHRCGRFNGFTLVDPLEVIAIIAILASILFPVFAQVRSKARDIATISNLKYQKFDYGAHMQQMRQLDRQTPSASGPSQPGHSATP